MYIENIFQLILVILVLAVLVFLLIYLGKKIRRLPGIKNTEWKKILYILLFILLLIISYFIAGQITIIFFMYSILLFLLADAVWVGLKHGNDKVRRIAKRLYIDGLSVLVIAAIICLFGYVGSKQIKLTAYTLDINKSFGDLESVDLFMVSDLHIGTLIKEKELDLLLSKIEEEKPDLVVLCGDIFDENSPTDLINYAYEIFEQISVPLGVYYVFGNHEVYTYDLDKISRELANRGVKVLKDEAVLVGDSFYVVGRMDAAITRNKGSRKSIESLVGPLDKKFPIIVLDHQPMEYEKNKEAKVDLLLSGHTHAGQVFPITIFSSFVNEKNYGYEEDGEFHAIVTSGMGTWGFPIRVGTNSEMVLIHLK